MSAATEAGYMGIKAEYLYCRDNLACECGHKCISHGTAGPELGDGACGVDRDTRNAASGYLGDPCPCGVFTGVPV